MRKLGIVFLQMCIFQLAIGQFQPVNIDGKLLLQTLLATGKYVDLYGNNSKERRFITFYGYGGGANSKAGHAFVSFGTYNYNTNSCQATAYGYYPEITGLKALVGIVPGSIVDEAFRGMSNLDDQSINITFEVPPEDFANALHVLEATRGVPGNYVATLNDCVTFMGKVGAAIGFKMPSRFSHLFPYGYVEALIKEVHSSNGKIGFKGERKIFAYDNGVYVGEAYAEVPEGIGTATNPIGVISGHFVAGSLAKGSVSTASNTISGTFLDYGPSSVNFSGTNIGSSGTTTTVANFELGQIVQESYTSGANGWSFGGTTIQGRPKHGKLTVDGYTFEGEFEKGAPFTGTLTYPSGVKFIGYLTNGSPRYGEMTWPSGQKFVGTFANGKPLSGSMYFPDGSYYVGQFKNGSFHGKGRYTWPDGRFLEGEFENGHIKEQRLDRDRGNRDTQNIPDSNGDKPRNQDPPRNYNDRPPKEYYGPEISPDNRALRIAFKKIS